MGFKMKTESDELEYNKAVERMLDYAKRTKKDYINNLMNTPKFELLPCKTCGRVVYVGKCCDNPQYEVIEYGND